MSNVAQTSLFSFLAIAPKLSDRQREVYNAMRAYNRPFTDKDLARYMGLEINKITGRRGEILKKGLIRNAGTIIQEGRSANLWECGKII